MVELYIFNNFKFSCEVFRFFDCDNVVVVYVFYCFSDKVFDFFISSRDCSNLSDRFFVFDWFRNFF